MKSAITYVLSFTLAFTFTILGIAGVRTVLGYNDHIHLFHGGSAAYVADQACTIDTPLNRSVDSMKRSFDECVRLHIEYQEYKNE
tara:strand:+ start:1301 stop:1555 length:255 start_codon:yes stop_codon:yes gene_type:complete